MFVLLFAHFFHYFISFRPPPHTSALAIVPPLFYNSLPFFIGRSIFRGWAGVAQTSVRPPVQTLGSPTTLGLRVPTPRQRAVQGVISKTGFQDELLTCSSFRFIPHYNIAVYIALSMHICVGTSYDTFYTLLDFYNINKMSDN